MFWHPIVVSISILCTLLHDIVECYLSSIKVGMVGRTFVCGLLYFYIFSLTHLYWSCCWPNKCYQSFRWHNKYLLGKLKHLNTIRKKKWNKKKRQNIYLVQDNRLHPWERKIKLINKLYTLQTLSTFLYPKLIHLLTISIHSLLTFSFYLKIIYKTTYL